MKVALVHDFLFKLGGAERVVKELADLFPKAPIYTLLYDEKKCGSVFPRERVKPSPLLLKYPEFMRQRPPLLLAKMPQAIEDFDFSDYDLVISSSGAFSHAAITGPYTKHICYCHSPMRYAWDYSHKYLFEKQLNPLTEWYARRLLHGIRQWDRASADRPDLYIANSEHVAKRLKKYYQVDSKVIYPPVNVDRFYPYEEAGDYFVMVSALTPFKKIDIAISAFNKMGKKLMIIGDGAQKAQLEALAGPTVELTGRLSDQEVQDRIQGSKALVFVNEEDFGIVPVEAMAAGKPVIAYGVGGVRETVIDGITGVFFDEQTPESLELAVAQFYELESSFSADIIHQRAQEFGRQPFRQQMKKALEPFLKV